MMVELEKGNIIDLAGQITDASRVIENIVQEHNINLSVNPNDPDPAFISGPYAKTFHQARVAIIEASSKLTKLLSGDMAHLTPLCSHFHAASAMRVATKFKLAACVPREGSITYKEVAEKCGLDIPTVSSIMGILMCHNIFYQPEKGRVAHTRLSYQIVAHEGFASLVDFTFGELFSHSYHITDALVKWGPSQEPNETGFNYARNTTQKFYDYMDHEKKLQSSFSKMMDFISSSELSTMDAIHDVFDWDHMGNALVIDLAGSVGHVSIGLAQHYPNLQFIVQDYESVCRRGETLLPLELRDRVKFQPHDMFNAQVKVLDQRVIYLIRHTLHNWSDKYASKILSAVAVALKPGDRIVLSEEIVPESGTAASWIEQLSRTADMSVFSSFNGHERTADQLQALISTIHPALQVIQIKTKAGLPMGTVEIALK